MADRAANGAPSGEESVVRDVANASPVPAAAATAAVEPVRPPPPVVVYAAPPPKDAAADSGEWVLVHGPAKPAVASSSSFPSDSVIEDAGVCGCNMSARVVHVLHSLVIT